MLKRITVVPFAAALLLLLLPTSAHALGFFVGAGIGEEVEASSLQDELGDFNPKGDDASYKLFAGLTLTRLLGVEVALYDFGSRTCCENLADAGLRSDLDGTSAALLVGLPLPIPRIHVYGKVGLLDWQEEGSRITIAGPSPFSRDGTDLLLGVGARVRILKHFGVRGEWERYEFDGASADALWLGAELRW